MSHFIGILCKNDKLTNLMMNKMLYTNYRLHGNTIVTSFVTIVAKKLLLKKDFVAQLDRQILSTLFYF